MKQESDEKFGEDETARRRDEVIKRMLNTPPKPRRRAKGAKERPVQKGHVHKAKSRS